MLARHVHLRPEWAFRLQTLGFVLGTAIVAAAAGRFLANAPQGTIPMAVVGLAALAGGIVLFTIPVEKLFLGWLFLAPLFQNSADATSMGKPLVYVFYLGPALVIIAHLAIGRPVRPKPTPSFYDALPAAYVVWVFVSVAITTSLFQDDLLSTGKALFQVTLIGVVVYYFVSFGPGVDISASAIIRALFGGAIVQAVLSLVEWRTGWAVWGQNWWQTVDLPRSSATLASPGTLGVFLGCCIVVALAVLAWDGPRSLRGPSWLVLALGIPGLLVTLTRGPIVATAVVSLAVLVLHRHARMAAIGAVALAVVALVAMWPKLTETELYQQRIADSTNVAGRADIQDVSLKAAARKPFFGWGYGSFDEARNVEGQDFAARVQGSLSTTSHNGFLTILVELGALGLAFLLVPWIAIGARGWRALRDGPTERWVLVGSLAAVAVFFLTAQTTDFKYFSLAQTLPWLFLGLVRRAQPEAGVTSTS